MTHKHVFHPHQKRLVDAAQTHAAVVLIGRELFDQATAKPNGGSPRVPLQDLRDFAMDVRHKKEVSRVKALVGQLNKPQSPLEGNLEALEALELLVEASRHHKLTPFLDRFDAKTPKGPEWGPEAVWGPIDRVRIVAVEFGLMKAP